MQIYLPLYPVEGGPPLGFFCSQCRAVTKTIRGVRIHLWRRHKLKEQIEMFSQSELTA